MRQKVGDRWRKVQALGQKINFPYCAMAKVNGSWLAARSRLQISKEGLCPSQYKKKKRHKDVSLFWIQYISCGAKSSKWKFPSQSEEEQHKDLSLRKAGGSSWGSGVNTCPSWRQRVWAIRRACLENTRRSPEPKAVPGSAQSQEDWESTAPVWWNLKAELGEHPSQGSLSRAVTPSNK